MVIRLAGSCMGKALGCLAILSKLDHLKKPTVLRHFEEIPKSALMNLSNLNEIHGGSNTS